MVYQSAVRLGGQQKMALLLKPLPSTQGAGTEFLAPAFHLAQPRLSCMEDELLLSLSHCL